ncbi:MAG TPA: hypothetical protein VFB95_03350 [Candidatus Cryosericum sp.]|nr:hypothetical protein [Candidatus Cryosericum sp.]
MTMTRWGFAGAGCLLITVVLLSPVASRAASRARGSHEVGPALLIAADRVTGFVPFTVTVYGRIRGVEPESIELCRLRIPVLSEPAADHTGPRPGSESEARNEPNEPTACVSGRAIASAGWLAYEHDLRFDQAGQYHVRLTMVDSAGRRLTSNTVRVSAF